MFAEFEFIDKMKRRFALGEVGDDCAILPRDESSDLLVSADMLVENVDFRISWSTPESIGHKALAVSLSDVAAMGGTPLWSILSLAIPKVHWDACFGERFFAGYMKLAEQFGVELTGGDLSSSPTEVVVDSTVIGVADKGLAIRRSTAHAGDLICVTGSLGAAAAALRNLEAGVARVKTDDELLSRLLEPIPRVDAGRMLGKLQICGAMIDISDGLVGDLGHICRQSGVGADLDARRIPRFPSQSVSLDDALYGGEDFELLFTVDPAEYELHRNELADHAVSVIGEITSNVEMIRLNDGTVMSEIDGRGFRHF
jgi:thiamine-monophosphate kinase